MGIVAANLDRRRTLIVWSGWILSLVAPLALTLLLNLVGGPKSREYAFLYLGLVAIIAVTFGQQRVIKTWRVGHNELPGEPGAGQAPGTERS